MSPTPKDARRKPSRASTVGKSPEPAKKKKSKKAVKPGQANQTAKASKPPETDLDQLGELPRSHGTDRIFLTARDPHRLYCYWDIDIARHPGGPTSLRAFVGSEDSPESEHPVTFESRNHELPALQAGSRYTVELGYLRGTQWHCLARSATVTTPPDRMADTPGTTFTTISWPDKPTSSPRPPLTSHQTVLSPLAELPLQHRRILEVLLGQNFLNELSSASFSSEEISSRIRVHLEELLSSGSASELLARIPGALAAPFGSSGHSALLPTLTTTQLIEWTRETLSSFAPESSWSSWFSLGGSSWAEVSSFLVSSWNEGPGSHFLSSWMAGPAGELSSMDHLSNLSSWDGHSENLSSPGHLHETASPNQNEILLQGRLHPGSQLTIDGHPISVHPDGSFRHLLSLDDSDGAHEVILSAAPPVGTAIHRTILRRDRKTNLVQKGA